MQTGLHSYTASHHADWAIGPTLHGGCVAALFHLTAVTHFTTTLKQYDQPDVLTLHIEFLRYCVSKAFEITVVELKRGGTHCTIQIQLAQKGQIKAIALATSTNFNESLGPSSNTNWTLNPPPAKPIPDFTKVMSNKPDENWIPGRVNGEVIPLSRHMLVLNPRGGYLVPGVWDAWNRFTNEPMDATCLALMCDIVPSMSDTLLRNGGIYDAHGSFAIMDEWANKRPGEVCELTNSLAEAATAEIFDNTLTMDIEFKKKLPDSGIQWLFTRALTRKLDKGRMDLELTICDQEMDLICLSRQSVLVLDARRRFKTAKNKPNL
ncbi:hypothetical protein FZEAL_4591 [Fusarium zealandicum]|uniref:Thioesterase family protein n=1 Tax=Fusarium zealandicum TaxID=1053134 RepID=A0A8H4XKP3_9HYPO|nr:hypothetical protein FZEAL_4591 [Fusarium zealandicum]